MGRGSRRNNGNKFIKCNSEKPLYKAQQQQTFQINTNNYKLPLLFRKFNFVSNIIRKYNSFKIAYKAL